MAEVLITEEVKCYPYRTATVRDRFLSLPRKLVRALEEELARKAGVRPDNHVVYEFIHENRDTVYVLFTDHKAHFGKTLYEGRW